MKLALGYVAAQALHAAAKLSIADLLASGPRDVEELKQMDGQWRRITHHVHVVLDGILIIIERT